MRTDRDWWVLLGHEMCDADLVGPDGVNMGFPNRVSRAAYREMDQKCRDRWPNDPHHPPNDIQPESSAFSRALRGD